MIRVLVAVERNTRGVMAFNREPVSYLGPVRDFICVAVSVSLDFKLTRLAIRLEHGVFKSTDVCSVAVNSGVVETALGRNPSLTSATQIS